MKLLIKKIINLNQIKGKETILIKTKNKNKKWFKQNYLKNEICFDI